MEEGRRIKAVLKEGSQGGVEGRKSRKERRIEAGKTSKREILAQWEKIGVQGCRGR
jgi:hypothetical protein